MQLVINDNLDKGCAEIERAAADMVGVFSSSFFSFSFYVYEMLY